MKTVALQSEILGRQFNLYCRAQGWPEQIGLLAEMRELSVQIDLLKLNPSKSPTGTWKTEVVLPIRHSYLAKLRQLADKIGLGAN